LLWVSTKKGLLVKTSSLDPITLLIAFTKLSIYSQ
jgi:hypothetical protein